MKELFKGVDIADVIMRGQKTRVRHTGSLRLNSTCKGQLGKEVVSTGESKQELEVRNTASAQCGDSGTERSDL